MANFDSVNQIIKIDKGNILGSILKLPSQIDQAWREVKTLEIPEEYRGAKNIVVSGMGGSALGGRIVDSLIADRVRAPLEVFTEFKLPYYVNKDTLAIFSSYSGETEETISAAKQAIEKGAKTVAICTGGKLEELFRQRKLPVYLINPIENPSKQPRMGVGYSISSTLAILNKLEFIAIDDTEIFSIIRVLGESISDFGVESPENKNLAKKLALKLKGKIPVLVASEHLLGSTHAFKNQLNENAKTFANLFDIPELNHHLLEGLRNPHKAKELLHFVLLESELYSAEIQKRYPITRDVIEQNGVETSIYKVRSEKKLDQIFEILVLGSFVSLYLAVLYDLDPSPIPWVDYFKSKL